MRTNVDVKTSVPSSNKETFPHRTMKCIFLCATKDELNDQEFQVGIHVLVEYKLLKMFIRQEYFVYSVIEILFAYEHN